MFSEIMSRAIGLRVLLVRQGLLQVKFHIIGKRDTSKLSLYPTDGLHCTFFLILNTCVVLIYTLVVVDWV